MTVNMRNWNANMGPITPVVCDEDCWVGIHGLLYVLQALVDSGCVHVDFKKSL